MTSSLSWRLAFCFTLWLSQPLSLQAQETLADWRDVPVAQLEQGAQNGVADAQYALGLRLEKGRGLLQNFALAATWFTRAADQGHAAAQHRLGQYYFDGIGVETNAQAALNWLRKAAQAGDATYLYDLARVLETQPEGKPLAADLYQQAADLGHQEAAVSLAVLYQNGTGVAQDFARALQLYEGPAAAGQARAQNNLGLLYVRGNGVQQDYVRAAALFQAAADQGLALAMGNLATMYENGFGVPLDEALAVELHQLAARKNSAKTGNLHPGWVFDTRLAPPDSSAEALERLRQGVTRGDPLAGFLLGWHHLQKTETSQEEFRQAARLLRSSAEAGYPPAMANLGLMYFEGRALPQDYVLGYMWLVLAASAGQPEAPELAVVLSVRMTQSQLVEAQELAVIKGGDQLANR